MAPKQKPGRSKQDYATPQEFIKAACKLVRIDGFAWDLAASPENTVAANYFTEAQNSLVQDWTKCEGAWLWLNPPYGHIEPWVKKVYESKMNIAVLLPASVGANWWARWVHRKCDVYFLNGRLNFMRDKPKWLYPKDCALLLYGVDHGASYNVWDWRKS